MEVALNIELFRANILKDPTAWVGHDETARIAKPNGDFETALKLAVVPEMLKPQVVDLIGRLENQSVRLEPSYQPFTNSSASQPALPMAKTITRTMVMCLCFNWVLSPSGSPSRSMKRRMAVRVR